MLDFTLRECSSTCTAPSRGPPSHECSEPVLYLHGALHSRGVLRGGRASGYSLRGRRARRSGLRGWLRAAAPDAQAGGGFLDLRTRRASRTRPRPLVGFRRPPGRFDPPRSPRCPLSNDALYGAGQCHARRHNPRLESERPLGCRGPRRSGDSPRPRLARTPFRPCCPSARSLVARCVGGTYAPANTRRGRRRRCLRAPVSGIEKARLRAGLL